MVFFHSNRKAINTEVDTRKQVVIVKNMSMWGILEEYGRLWNFVLEKWLNAVRGLMGCSAVSQSKLVDNNPWCSLPSSYLHIPALLSYLCFP